VKRKPKLGQNFLVDEQARQAIADALGDASGRTVIEIGPGHGAITEILAGRCARLVAIEIDRALAAELRFRFRERPQVEVVEADVLATGLLGAGSGWADRRCRRQPAVLHRVGDSAALVCGRIGGQACSCGGDDAARSGRAGCGNAGNAGVRLALRDGADECGAWRRCLRCLRRRSRRRRRCSRRSCG